MKVVLIIFYLAGSSFLLNAQGVSNSNSTGMEHGRVATGLPALRQADVVYAKKVQRIIDSHEKKNIGINWPLNSFMAIIYKLAEAGDSDQYGKLKVYTSDSLNTAFTIRQIAKIGSYTSSAEVVIDTLDPGITKTVEITNPFDLTTVQRYLIAEDWIFDKQTGQFFPRIVAIAPLYKPNFGGIEANVEYPMFWIKYDELRPFLVKEQMFNAQNDAARFTYYDFFEQRMFGSHITKESNAFNLAISDMPEFKDAPLDALHESENIKNTMINWESDLWEQ